MSAAFNIDGGTLFGSRQSHNTNQFCCYDVILPVSRNRDVNYDQLHIWRFFFLKDDKKVNEQSMMIAAIGCR